MVYTNSARNIVLRQTFAIEMVSRKLNGKIFINFDKCTFSDNTIGGKKLDEEGVNE